MKLTTMNQRSYAIRAKVRAGKFGPRADNLAEAEVKLRKQEAEIFELKKTVRILRSEIRNEQIYSGKAYKEIAALQEKYEG